MDNNNLSRSKYGYSGVKIENLGATEYTLVTIAVDLSSSVQGFKDELEKSLVAIAKSCKFSPRSDNLMLRVMGFNSSIEEIHGFKMLSDIIPDDYIGSLNIGGTTALYDASQNAIDATSDYAEKLRDQDYLTNAVVFILTDGADNSSTHGPNVVKTASESAMKAESLESIVTVLIGVGVADKFVAQYLADFQKDAKITSYIDAGAATPQNLAKLAAFVSKSISAANMENKFKVGDSVHYIPYKDAPVSIYENGIVKSKHPDKDNCVFVVYKTPDWSNYQNYTAALTDIKDLRPGWV
jgi:hypothetical protein